MPASASARRPGDRAAWTVLAVAGVLAACYLGWLVGNHADARDRAAVSDIAFIVAPLVAAFACRAASRRDEAGRSGWWWLTVTTLLWAAGSLAWGFYEVVLGHLSPFPSLADIGYVGYAVPALLALARFPRSGPRSLSTTRLNLDALVIAGGLLYASAVWVLGPVLADSGRTGLAQLDALAYPLADVTVASFVLATAARHTSSRQLSWLTMGCGLLLLAATDSSYAAQTYIGSFSTGRLLDFGWVGSFLLIAVAALLPATAAAARDDEVAPPTLFQQLLPYGPVLLALTAGRYHPPVDGHGQWVTWLGWLLAGAVVVRQLVVIGDHVALTRDLSDIVERRTAELSRREAWSQALLRNLSDVVIVIGADGTLPYCSPSMLPTLGHRPEQLPNVGALEAQVHPDDLEPVRRAVRPVALGRRQKGYVECRVRHANGSWRWFEVTAISGRSGAAIDGAVLTLHDITERQLLTERLTHQAFHDSLTGLPNRAMFIQQMHDALGQRRRHELAVIFIDLDDFKLINDTHGHAAGDVVLTEIGRRLQESTRETDVVARLGGDEFAVLVVGTVRQVTKVAERIGACVRRPVQVDGREFIVGASIGVVFAARHEGESVETLLSHADIALYEAKGKQKGGVVTIAGEDRSIAARQVFLREQVTRPDLSQFRVVYQPLVESDTGRLRGVEALLRWSHPELGEVSPADFIPLAEHGGSIRTLGWFVLETTCRQLADWSRRFPDTRLAAGINVSVLQLDEPDFAAGVSRLITRYRLHPDQLVLEITEQALARDFDTVVAAVASLREAGVSVAVDDFGTGHSSLRYLDRFAADVVKIDKTFIDGITRSEHTRKLVQSVIDMAASLDLQCIAEGVETLEQLDVLRSMTCELAQGYLFSRPVPAAELETMLTRTPALLKPVEATATAEVVPLHAAGRELPRQRPAAAGRRRARS